jgi:hypothetical protein
MPRRSGDGAIVELTDAGTHPDRWIMWRFQRSMRSKRMHGFAPSRYGMTALLPVLLGGLLIFAAATALAEPTRVGTLKVIT